MSIIVGRKAEQDELQKSLYSKKPEFIVIYGRRRVGKTFLIKEYFNEQFAFYATGMPNEKTKDQLKSFHESLLDYGDLDKTIPKDWFEAFRRLKNLLKSPHVRHDPASGRIVVFLDEVPWMDTPRSDFRSALDHFWNSFGSSQKDLLLIVCGSATSWIIKHILGNRGGFYNRITNQIYLAPFSLSECEEYYKSNGLQPDKRQVIESYMVFGGIPYYMNFMDRRLSIPQNIDNLLFKENGKLFYEYDNLFRSLYRNPENHKHLIEIMSKAQHGVLRTDLVKRSKLSNGEGLTIALSELEQCGFIRKYKNFTKNKQGFFYQIIDPFVLFAIHFLQKERMDSWINFLNTPEYFAWRGNAFELVCLNHISQLKSALGISGVESTAYSWRSKKTSPGAQIDLLIDRKDGIINLCEMKYTDSPFTIDKNYENNLIHKQTAFLEETQQKKAIHITLVSPEGLKRNEHSDIVVNVITKEDLFRAF